jgi:NAD dependent epimerase/dehydratase family enzyme
VTNAELSRTLGRILHRPAVLPVPAAAVRLLYGEMAMVVTTGQNVPPTRLQETGYTFAFAELQPALGDLLG